jgi:hypothetical protein
VSDCALQAGRQSHVRDIIQKYRERVRRGGGCTVLLVCSSSSTTERELRASGQVSFLDWPDTTLRGDGRHDASLAASASHRETLSM